MSNETNVKVQGFSTLGLLGVAFIVLKLCNVIEWSWWLVLLPFYGGLALALAFPAVVLLIAGLLTVTEKK